MVLSLSLFKILSGLWLNLNLEGHAGIINPSPRPSLLIAIRSGGGGNTGLSRTAIA